MTETVTHVLDILQALAWAWVAYRAVGTYYHVKEIRRILEEDFEEVEDAPIRDNAARGPCQTCCGDGVVPSPHGGQIDDLVEYVPCEDCNGKGE